MPHPNQILGRIPGAGISGVSDGTRNKVFNENTRDNYMFALDGTPLEEPVGIVLNLPGVVVQIIDLVTAIEDRVVGIRLVP